MSEIPCFAMFFGGSHLNIGGEMSPLNLGGMGLQGKGHTVMYIKEHRRGKAIKR